jgi:hypothetical protein
MQFMKEGEMVSLVRMIAPGQARWDSKDCEKALRCESQAVANLPENQAASFGLRKSGQMVVQYPRNLGLVITILGRGTWGRKKIGR